MGSEGGGVMMMNRAEIDTSPPFKSVKEAVILFGDKFLAAELYPNKIKQMEREENDSRLRPSNLGTITAELEETKQYLEKAKEESMLMAHSLSSIKDELERTKYELQELKQQECAKREANMESEIEDVKIVETGSMRFDEVIKIELCDQDEEVGLSREFEKKRYVRFANSGSLAQVMVPQGQDVERVLERHPSMRRKKKKPLIQLIGEIFGKKKRGQEFI